MTCDRCSHLEVSLNDARKEIVALKDRAAILDNRARERKKLLDRVTTGQVEAADAVDAALTRLFFYINSSSPVDVADYVHKNQLAWAQVARTALEKYVPSEFPNKVRLPGEHAMPRHGKQSS